MASKRCADVCSSSHAPTAPPATLGIVNHASQRRAPVNSPRYAHMLPTAPGHSATVLVAFATRAGRPSQTMAGNVTSVPPPATELTAAADRRGEEDEDERRNGQAAVYLLASLRCERCD